MTWPLFVTCLVSSFVIANGIDIAFIHRDPPSTAKIATRTSRRIIGIIAILLGAANVILQIL